MLMNYTTYNMVTLEEATTYNSCTGRTVPIIIWLHRKNCTNYNMVTQKELYQIQYDYTGRHKNTKELQTRTDRRNV